MRKDMMNTKEVAEYLGIHEKQVYTLIKTRKIPCTRITGKWIFPKNIIDEWIDTHTKNRIIKEREGNKKSKGILLSAGSNDPILEILLSYMKKRHPNYNIFTCSTGSTDGLHMLREGETDIAWCHLFDPQSGQYNIPFLSTLLPNMKIAVVHLFYRELGFVTPPKTSFKINNFNDLQHDKLQFINRQEGSGTRILIDYYLRQANIEPSSINGYDRVVYSHFEVGLAILSKEATTGVATVAISKLFDLPFVPIVRESFDMVLSQDTFFEKGIQAFIDSLNTEEFRNMVLPLGDYDFSESGKIIYSTSQSLYDNIV